ncbi:MAG: hypothetical protein RMM28_00930 [Thermoleophilia bacterium]|nr:hypothetical protein [Thermoleophilia bacterium]
MKAGALIALAAALATALLAAPTALAKRDDDVRVWGTCTGGSTVKLKLSEEDGGIEVELEVDQNRNGVRWSVAIWRNGTLAVRTARVTKAPSGSFELRIVTPDRPGTDRFVGRATSPSGEVCTARASF